MMAGKKGSSTYKKTMATRRANRRREREAEISAVSRLAGERATIVRHIRPLRIYVDTSVFGGCFDNEFAVHSRRFFQLVKGGRVRILLSDLIIDELGPAPQPVQSVLLELDAAAATRIELSDEILNLRDEYLAAGVVGPDSLNDATHVAAATVARADAIVSWNFKHIVRLDRMKAYNAINLIQGYGLLTIISPREVLADEEE